MSFRLGFPLACVVTLASHGASAAEYYYCDATRAYYPAAPACPGPWRKVVVPASASQQPATATPPIPVPGPCHITATDVRMLTASECAAALAQADRNAPDPVAAPVQLTPPQGQQSEAFQQGMADRGGWEAWSGSSQGDYHEGAYYWSGQRSLAQPGPCSNPSMSQAWQSGCVEAQKRLALSDARRRSEPDYRKGWNSWVAAASATASPPPNPAPIPASAARANGLAVSNYEAKYIPLFTPLNDQINHAICMNDYVSMRWYADQKLVFSEYRVWHHAELTQDEFSTAVNYIDQTAERLEGNGKDCEKYRSSSYSPAPKVPDNFIDHCTPSADQVERFGIPIESLAFLMKESSRNDGRSCLNVIDDLKKLTRMLMLQANDGRQEEGTPPSAPSPISADKGHAASSPAPFGPCRIGNHPVVIMPMDKCTAPQKSPSEETDAEVGEDHRAWEAWQDSNAPASNATARAVQPSSSTAAAETPRRAKSGTTFCPSLKSITELYREMSLTIFPGDSLIKAHGCERSDSSLSIWTADGGTDLFAAVKVLPGNGRIFFILQSNILP